MKKLRLVFENINEERIDITLPMEKWIADWWFECDYVPSNDTVIIRAELNGRSVFYNRFFEEVTFYFNWNGLYKDFINAINNGSSFQNNSADFEKWLTENFEQ
jgi:hypothetical protein